MLTSVVAENKSKVTRQNTRHIKSALKIRTGREPGFYFNQKKLNSFDIIFPSQ